MILHGHAWTIGSLLWSSIQPSTPPNSEHWETTLDDPVVGSVRLTGRLHRGHADHPPDTLLVVVHGLGGSSQSQYVVHGARAAEHAGIACLRLNLRGADRSGQDFYHAGLTADLQATLASPTLERYRRIAVLGYSLGGHLALRYVCEQPDPRVVGIAAVCPPIDLQATVKTFDRPEVAIYREYVLRRLKHLYGDVYARGRGLVPLERARRIHTLREWDNTIVAPRHGFKDAEDYWARASVGPILRNAKRPALVVSALLDPMIPDATVRPALDLAENLTTVCLDRGGHVGFPSRIQLGFGGEGSLDDQIVAWLLRR